MTFREAREVLQGLTGRTVQVSIRLPYADGATRSFASFFGQVSDVSRATAWNLPAHWYVWIGNGVDPRAGHVRLDGALFEDAHVAGSGLSAEEAMAEDPESGTTWTLSLRHSGVATEILIYLQ